MRAPAPVALLICVVWPLAAQEYSTESFARELSGLEAAFDKDPAVALAALPAGWRITAGSQTYFVAADPLRELMKARNGNGVHARISEMRAHLTAFDLRTPQDSSKSQAKLKAILARPEFRGVAPPSAWELLVQRIREWLAEWLRKIFAYAAQHPTGSQVLFWTVVALAVTGLGSLLLRMWTSRDPLLSLPDPPAQKLVRQGWQQWLAEARAAAAAGDRAQAIRCAYWAAIARLQDDRRLHIDLTNTPRERLRILARPTHPREPLPADQLAPLTSITQRFEVSWYAKTPPTSDDLARTFENLEALGCKAD